MSSHFYNLGPQLFEVEQVGFRNRGKGSRSRYLVLRCLTDVKLSGGLDLPSWIEREFKTGDQIRMRLQDRCLVGALNREPVASWLSADEMEIDGHTLPVKKFKVQQILRRIGC